MPLNVPGGIGHAMFRAVAQLLKLKVTLVPLTLKGEHLTERLLRHLRRRAGAVLCVVHLAAQGRRLLVLPAGPILPALLDAGREILPLGTHHAGYVAKGGVRIALANAFNQKMLN